MSGAEEKVMILKELNHHEAWGGGIKFSRFSDR